MSTASAGALTPQNSAATDDGFAIQRARAEQARLNGDIRKLESDVARLTSLARIQRLKEWNTQWRELLPFVLFGSAAILGTLNLIRSRAEVALAKLTRVLLVAGLLAWLALPFLAAGGDLKAHLPQAWGALHLLPPLFLALDGAIACVAVTITRSSE